jgi:hypothetical protein
MEAPDSWEALLPVYQIQSAISQKTAILSDPYISENSILTSAPVSTFFM